MQSNSDQMRGGVDRSFVFLGLIACLACTGGCSLALDFTECSSNEDCAALGEGLVCSASNTCVEQAQECIENEDCADKAPRTECVAGACVDPNADVQDDLLDVGPDLPEICATHAQCAALGDDAICSPQGECVHATNDQCQAYVFPDALDNAIFIGSIMPTSAPYDKIGAPMQNATQLAIEDFNAAGGLPDGRLIAWLGCDSYGDSTQAKAAARHLTNTLEVPAIIGPIFSDILIDVANEVTTPKEVFLISPTATSTDITDLDDDGLVWRNICADDYQSVAIFDRIIELGSQKIVILGKNDTYGNGLLGSLNTSLSEEGSLTIYTANYANPTSFSSEEDLVDAYSRVVSDAITAVPDADLVLFLGTTETIDLFRIYLLGLENVGIPPGPFPEFIFSHGSIPDLPRSVADTSDQMIGFVEGISPDIFDESNYNAFNLRYRARFGGDTLSTTSLAYDATFSILFSLCSLEPNQDIDGLDIVDGMATLVDATATTIDFGNEDFILTAKDILSSDASVDLIGISGALDYDLATGDVRTDYLGWSIEKVSGTYRLKPTRTYTLEPEGIAGSWSDL